MVMNFFPIIISSGMLSLMSFVIDCAVFTSFLFDLLKIYISFFATIHHTGGGLLRDVSQQQDGKKGTGESPFRAVLQTLDKKNIA